MGLLTKTRTRPWVPAHGLASWRVPMGLGGLWRGLGRGKRTPTEDFLSSESERAFIDKIMDGNSMASRGYRISQVAWLKPRDKPIGKHG
jgi:hypothetical protein